MQIHFYNKYTYILVYLYIYYIQPLVYFCDSFSFTYISPHMGRRKKKEERETKDEGRIEGEDAGRRSSPITHYPLPISYFPFLISHFPFPIPHFLCSFFHFPFPILSFPFPYFQFPISPFPIFYARYGMSHLQSANGR